MRAADDQRKVPTVSRKIERLINLTIALLATKRFLTKQEIFTSVEGYEGSAETKERMFERDKDDLRNLGIEIDVGGFDPAFDDEAGYRIKSDKYSLDLGDISGVEIALLSLAAEAWRGAALDSAAQSALLKLKSMGIDSDLDSIPSISPLIRTPHTDFQSISLAISQRRTLSFSYLSKELDTQARRIQPYAIATQQGFWYLAGNDLDKGSLRTFRLDRFQGEITVGKESGAFEIPADFNILNSLSTEGSHEIATVDIRKGKAHLMRSGAISLVDMGEWDRVTVNFFDVTRMVDLVLWHGDDVLVISPEHLRSAVITALTTLVGLHG